jgi:hypothetical protein
MADEKLFKLPIVKADAIITIEVSGTFLKKCQTLLLQLGHDAGQDKIKAILNKFKDTNNVPEDTNEAVIFTLTALVGEMESQAVKQNQVEYKEVTADQLKQLYNPST